MSPSAFVIFAEKLTFLGTFSLRLSHGDYCKMGSYHVFRKKNSKISEGLKFTKIAIMHPQRWFKNPF